MDRFNVLIVDNDDASSEKLVSRLQGTGLDVKSVRNYKEALILLEETPFDVCVMEIMLSGIGDGIRTLDQIKRINPLTQVIILTAHASLEAGIKALQSGAYDFLIKPMQFEHLLERISHAHDRKIIEEGG